MKRILAAAAAFSLLAAAPAFACPGKDAKQAKATSKEDKSTASKDKKGDETPVKKG